MREGLVALLLVTTGAAALAAGSIEGKIEPAGRAKGIAAIARPPREIFEVTNLQYPGRIDAETGEFTIPGLGGGAYDLVLQLDGVTIEGVDLRLPKEKLPVYDLKLEGGKLSVTGLDPKRDLGQAEFGSEEEKDAATRLFFRIGSLKERFESILKVESFTDNVRGLYIHGGPTGANILVAMIRSTPFYGEAGDEVIWRLEVWPMRWYYGGWDKGRYYVIDRRRMSQAAYLAMSRLFDPKLGGIDVIEGKAARVEYRIPDKLDRSMGKPGGASF